MKTQSKLRSRWLNLWNRLGLSGDPYVWFDLLNEHYRQKHRFYHTWAHIEHGLFLIDVCRSDLIEPELVELAWWFHDVIYETSLEALNDRNRKSNEEQSADLACSLLDDSRLRMLIMTTTHKQIPTDPDAQFISDIDLAILGEDPKMFDRYDLNIHKEYAHIPEKTRRIVRRAILEQFLKRDPLYHHLRIRRLYENGARKNLTRAIEKLTPA